MVFVYDPVFTTEDRELFKELQMIVLSETRARLGPSTAPNPLLTMFSHLFAERGLCVESSNNILHAPL